jgi:hypothetical protein
MKELLMVLQETALEAEVLQGVVKLYEVFGTELRDNPKLAAMVVAEHFGRTKLPELLTAMGARQRAAKIMKEHKEP